jgi:hypothetical protein
MEKSLSTKRHKIIPLGEARFLADWREVKTSLDFGKRVGLYKETRTRIIKRFGPKLGQTFLDVYDGRSDLQTILVKGILKNQYCPDE